MPSSDLKTDIRNIWLGVGKLLLGLIFLLFALSLPVHAKSKSGYLYNLSSFTGPVTSLWSRLTVDENTGEVYSLNRNVSLVQIYNQNSMLIHSFGEEYRLSSAVDLAAADDGDIYLIQGTVGIPEILKLDYKGSLAGKVDLSTIPEAYQPFRPSRIEFHDGKLYLLDTAAMHLVVMSTDGEFLKGYIIRNQLTKTLGDDEEQQKKLASMDFNGFCVDRQGAMYFTAPTSFVVFKMEPDGSIRGFGSSGSAPGKFGVVAGVAVDSKGNIYVTDRLRCVVIVFGKEFNFIREFGHRGALPENLIAPDDVVIDEPNGKIYVAQAANRGVSVFHMMKK